MEYSISQVAREFGLQVSTLRYYDNIGLFTNLKKDSAGNRVFTEQDKDVIQFVLYLKKSGMQLTQIKEYIEWMHEGDSTIEKRLNMFKEQKKKVLKDMEKLKETLSLLEFKEWYYTKALEDGTEENVKKLTLEDMPEKVKKEYLKCHKKR